MPVVDTIAADYQGDVTFLAVAGKADMGRTAQRAGELLTDNTLWGLDDSIWDLYGVPGQPATVLIVDGVIIDTWFGALPEDLIRERLDRLVELAA